MSQAAAPLDDRPRLPVARLLLLATPIVVAGLTGSLWHLALLTPLVIMIGATGLLVLLLPRDLGRTLPIWIIAVYFQIAFGLRAISLARLAADAEVGRRFEMLTYVDREVIAESIVPSALVYLCFAVVALFAQAVLLPHPSPKTVVPRLALANWHVCVFYGVLTALQANAQYGVLGLDPVEFPLRLGVLLTTGRTLVAPALWALLLVTRSSSLARLSVIASIIVASLLDAVVTTSRGSLIRFFAPVVMCLLLVEAGRRLRARHVFAVGLLAVAAAVVLPIVTQERVARISGSSTPVSVSDAIAAVPDSLITITDRVIGLDGVVAVSDYLEGGDPERPTWADLLTERTNEFFTTEVLSISVANDFRTPGVVGGLLLFGGWTIVAAGIAIITCAIVACWSILGHARIPVIVRAMFAAALPIVLSDFSMTYAARTLLAIVIVEAIVRWRVIASGNERQPVVSTSRALHRRG